MAFANKIGNLLKKSVTSSPSLFQAIRCMSSSKLFVGGLSYGTDDLSLREAFTNYGEVVEARIITDRETGGSRGFGFVTFTSSEEASAAITGMDGKDLHGRIVRVNYANERTGGFRGGYGGGGGGYGGYSGGGGYGAGGNYEAGGGGYGGGGANTYGRGNYNTGSGAAAGNYGSRGSYGGSGREFDRTSAGANYGVAGGIGGIDNYQIDGSSGRGNGGYGGNNGLYGGGSGDSTFGKSTSRGFNSSKFSGGSYSDDDDEDDLLEHKFKDDDEPDDYAKRG
ncbi:uncharacterized protein LOC141846033 [Curcuma longa]|uniref:uncharacterized protein LOC141846033 n=1 Tax=Curcuma longa TaxID=136217 RepID=UPI003D9DE1F9